MGGQGCLCVSEEKKQGTLHPSPPRTHPGEPAGKGLRCHRNSAETGGPGARSGRPGGGPRAPGAGGLRGAAPPPPPRLGFSGCAGEDAELPVRLKGGACWLLLGSGSGEGGVGSPPGCSGEVSPPSGSQRGSGDPPPSRNIHTREPQSPGWGSGKRGTCWNQRTDSIRGRHGGGGLPGGSEGAPPTGRLRSRGCAPRGGAANGGRRSPRWKDSGTRKGLGVPSGSPGSPPPGSQGLPGREGSRLRSRPGAPRRPPAPGSRAGTPLLALLPGRRPSSAILRTVRSAPPPARPPHPRRSPRPRPRPPTPTRPAISGSTRK